MQSREVLLAISELCNREKSEGDPVTRLFRISMLTRDALESIPEHSYQRLMLSEMSDEEIDSTIIRLQFELKQRAKWRENHVK